MVSLERMTLGQSRKYTHVEEEDFVVTSSVPVSQLLTCDVLTNAFAGRIGRYLLPKDAVLKLKGRTKTTVKEVTAFLGRERASWASGMQNRLNHVTVERRAGVSEDEEDSDEFEVEETAEDEDEENTGDLVEDSDDEGWEDLAARQNDDELGRRSRERNGDRDPQPV